MPRLCAMIEASSALSRHLRRNSKRATRVFPPRVAHRRRLRASRRPRPRDHVGPQRARPRLTGPPLIRPPEPLHMAAHRISRRRRSMRSAASRCPRSLRCTVSMKRVSLGSELRCARHVEMRICWRSQNSAAAFRILAYRSGNPYRMYPFRCPIGRGYCAHPATAEAYSRPPAEGRGGSGHHGRGQTRACDQRCADRYP